MREDAMETNEVKETVGYHNYFRVGAFEAQELVQAKCPDGWRAAVDVGGPIPAGAVRVGQVRVHHGDPVFPLYVYPIPS
jgi:hypothetical protein